MCSDIDIWFLQGKFVAEAMSVIAANTDVPVSVKCRIGVDNHDSYNELCKVLFLNILVLLKYQIRILFYTKFSPSFRFSFKEIIWNYFWIIDEE